MSDTDRTANDLREWEEATTAIAANAADLPQAEVTRVALEKLTDELRKLGVDQKLHQAAKQMITQRIAVVHRDGSKLATILRFMVKQHYGSHNDKLVELGVKPLRARARKVTGKPEPPPVTVPTPTDHPATPTVPAAAK
jgi:N-glycosylase/DNA lyase